MSTSAVTLTSVYLLSGVVTARAAALGCLDALAVDHCGCRTGVAANPFAVDHHEVVVIGSSLVVAAGANQRCAAKAASPSAAVATGSPPG